MVNYKRTNQSNELKSFEEQKEELKKVVAKNKNIQFEEKHNGK